jgi:coenzyme F420-0:L-glutamate ligase/coenzyme F420-1:gamma-L-glutamate ligase
MPAGGRLEVIGVPGIKEAIAGDVVADLIARASRAAGMPVRPADILVVAQKLVSKAEGCTVWLSTVQPGAEARRIAAEVEKDPRVVEVVLSQSRRILRAVKGVLIVETHHGFICANAGVDASNVPGGDVVTLLPPDPDASARRVRDGLEAYGARPVAVIISDSFNRPWREGSVNVAIGVAGMAPLLDQRGETDDHGRVLRATVVSVADEVASAAQLVMGETRGTPVAIVRGVPVVPSEEGSAKLLRDPARDLFRQG